MIPPEPSPDRANQVRTILKDLDPLLDIIWLPFGLFRRGVPIGCYALTCRWPQTDKRWELYHSGEIEAPYDIMGRFVGDGSGSLDWFGEGQEAIQDPLSVMDAALEMLGRCDNQRESWKTRLRRSAQHNRDLAAKRRKDAADEMLLGLVEDRIQATGAPLVRGFDVHGKAAPRLGNTPTKELSHE